MLTFNHVSLELGKRQILKDVHFTVEPKERVAVLGPSGAGKSSVFRLLVGEVRPTLGSVKLDDMALEDLSWSSMQAYRRRIGVVFQDFRLLSQKTVFENVAFALEVCGERNKVPTMVPHLLKFVGLERKQDLFPHQISGGERQRVAIARALVHKPGILIADEPTGNLDPKASREIAELFATINRKHEITLLLATHDPLVVDVLKPRVIRIENGTVLFDDPKCSTQKAFEGMM